jgi:hypothetical protein
VREQERGVQPGDDEVLVVARVGDDGGPVAGARQVLEEPTGLDTELGPVGRLVELGLTVGPPPNTESSSMRVSRVF